MASLHMDPQSVGSLRESAKAVDASQQSAILRVSDWSTTPVEEECWKIAR